MRCARCHRNVTAPIFAAGMPLGPTCFRKVAGAKPKRRIVNFEGKRAPVKPDPLQRELFV
jgi:hypothetical protein